MIYVFTVPHSGTKWVRNIFQNAGYDLPFSNNQHMGRNGKITHLHHIDGRYKLRNRANPTLIPLRDPLMTLISHAAGGTPWQEQKANLTKSFVKMLEIGPDVFYMPIENITDERRHNLQYCLYMATARTDILDFETADRESSGLGGDLKFTAKHKDLRTLEDAMPLHIKFGRECMQKVGHIYKRYGYDLWWTECN